MNIDLLFPTPIGIQMHDRYTCEQYAKMVLTISEEEESHKHPYVGCVVTPDDLNERKQFSGMVEIIDENVKVYAREVLGVDPKDLKLDCMWANVHSSGNKHQSHVHPNSFISGAFYLNVPKADMVGDIYFNDPRVVKNMVYADFIKPSHISDRNWIYKPETGMMILFPGWLEHGTNVFVCESGEKRVVVSFNYSLLKCSGFTMRFNHGSKE